MRLSIDFFSARSKADGSGGLNVTLFGGEPLLLATSILELVSGYGGKTAEGEALRFSVCTNGTLLDHSLLDSFLELDIGVFLSIDGPRETHDRNRRDAAGRGSFGAIEPFIPRLVPTRVAVETVLARNALATAAKSLEWLVASGFRNIIAIPDFSDEWTSDDLTELERQYRRMAGFFSSHVASGDPFIFSLFSDQISLEACGLSYRDLGCTMGRGRFVVGPDLRIHPCTRFAKTGGISVGNVMTGISDEALSDVRLRHDRDRPECAACDLRKRCLGNNCACLSASLEGDYDKVSPLLCEHGRMLARVVEGIPDLVDAARARFARGSRSAPC